MQLLKVVSSDFEARAEARLRAQQSRFSVLLAVLRSRLTPEQYQILWRMHFCSRQLVRGRKLEGPLEQHWINVMRRELDDMFASLERGEFSAAQLDRVVHLYGDLFRIV